MNHQILVIFPFRITAVSGRQAGVEKEKNSSARVLS